ncbi:hypothetical protein MTO96_051379 [Rhipicephalus appendiculatus]
MPLFVNTTRPVWTYKTTQTDDVLCRVDVMRQINPAFIYFNRTHVYHGRTIRIQLHGVFRRVHKERMDVGPLAMRPTYEEYLLFMSRDSTCAVIMVRSSIATYHYYDLRVRDCSIRAGPHPKLQKTVL